MGTKHHRGGVPMPCKFSFKQLGKTNPCKSSFKQLQFLMGKIVNDMQPEKFT